MKICVIGAGVSGLSVARLLKDDFEVEILEKDEFVGGIARTRDVNGIAYHLNGGHGFTSYYDDVKDFVFNEVLGKDEWNLYYKQAKILFKNHWIDNPIENSVLQINAFDEDMAFNITQEMFNASYERGENLEEWFINHYGKTLAKEYFIPYNTKIWGIEPRLMDSIWTVDDKQMKLPIPNKKNFYNSIVGTKAIDPMVEASGFRYPKSNNQNTFLEALAKGLGLKLNYQVNSIEKANDKWIINGEKQYDLIINTSPLDMIPRVLKGISSDVKAYFDKLKFNKISNVLCESDELDFTWAYIPDKNIGFHRIINIGKFFTPAKNYCIVEKLGEFNVEYFEKEKVKIPKIKSIIDHNITAHAYILFDLNCVKSRKETLAYLNSIGLISHGRFGEWEYYNMDVCIKRSIDLAKAIKSKNL